MEYSSKLAHVLTLRRGLAKQIPNSTRYADFRDEMMSYHRAMIVGELLEGRDYSRSMLHSMADFQEKYSTDRVEWPYVCADFTADMLITTITSSIKDMAKMGEPESATIVYFSDFLFGAMVPLAAIYETYLNLTKDRNTVNYFVNRIVDLNSHAGKLSILRRRDPTGVETALHSRNIAQSITLPQLVVPEYFLGGIEAGIDAYTMIYSMHP